jgi:hypothetical protein
MLAIAAAQLGYAATSSTRTSIPARPTSRPLHARRFDDARRSPRFAARATSSPTSSRICRSSRSKRSATSLRPARARCRRPGPRGREALHREPARGSRRGAEVDDLKTIEAAIAALGLPLVLKTRRFGYDGKGQAWIRSPKRRRRAWEAIGGEPAVAEPASTSPPNSRSSSRAGRRASTPSGTRPQRSSRRHPAPLDRAAGDPIERRSRKRARRRRAHRRSARPCRRADGRILRLRRRAGGQRDRAARPQQRPLDDRGRHLAVRAAHPRDLRPAAGRHRAGRARGDDGQSDRRRRRAGPSWSPSPAPRPPLRQGRSPPRPQDGPRHAAR